MGQMHEIKLMMMMMMMNIPRSQDPLH